MKKFFFTALISMSLFAVYAQPKGTNTITGKVVDSTSKAPLEYATVTLFFRGHTKPVNGGTTDKNGVYTITDVRDSVFNIVFEFIGYNAHTLNNIAVNNKKGPVNLATILLARKTGVLQGITIVAQGKLIENKIDKMVFNAERDVTSQSGVPANADF